MFTPKASGLSPALERGFSASSSAAVQHGDNSFQGVEGDAENEFMFRDVIAERLADKPVFVRSQRFPYSSDCVGHFFKKGQGAVTLNLGRVIVRTLRTNWCKARVLKVAVLVPLQLILITESNRNQHGSDKS